MKTLSVKPEKPAVLMADSLSTAGSFNYAMCTRYGRFPFLGEDSSGWHYRVKYLLSQKQLLSFVGQYISFQDAVAFFDP